MTQDTLPTTTETRAVSAPKATATIKGMLSSDVMKQQFAAALPRHLSPERFTRIALTALTKTPKLAQCTQASFFQALLTLSSFGLEPDGRRAHLIPYENKKAGTVECQLIIDYKGLVELAMRSGLVSVIFAEVVCENDDFEYNLGEVTKHKIDLKKDRGEAYAVYAMCKYKDGATGSAVMSLNEAFSLRDRSQGYQAFQKGYTKTNPWVTDEREMLKKTAIRRLSKMMVLSPEFRYAVEADDDVIELAPVAKRTTETTLDTLADNLAAEEVFNDAE